MTDDISRWLVEKAGVRVTICCESEASEQLLQPILEAIPARRIARGEEVGVRLTVAGEPGKWFLRDHQKSLKFSPARPGDLIYYLTDRLAFHLANNISVAHCLHAAAVAVNGNTLVIPANSGSGKSIFTAWLVANGFHYLTDELILFSGGELDALIRPLQIKSAGIDAVTPLLVDPDRAYKGNRVHALTAASLGGSVSAKQCHRISAMLFLKYRKNGAFIFEHISASAAGIALMSNHVNARNLEDHGFPEMMALIRETPCYHLEYSGFTSLATDFPQRLRAVLSGAAGDEG